MAVARLRPIVAPALAVVRSHRSADAQAAARDDYTSWGIGANKGSRVRCWPSGQGSLRGVTEARQREGKGQCILGNMTTDLGT